MYLSNVLNKNDRSDSKINLNSKITVSIAGISGIAGGAGNEFLNIYVNDSDKQPVIESNDEIRKKKFFIQGIINQQDTSVTQLNREIVDYNYRKTSLESKITNNITKSRNISDFKFNISSGLIDSEQLTKLRDTLKTYSEKYNQYLKLYTDTKKEIEKIEEIEKPEKPKIDDKIKNLLDELKEIKDLDEIKEILKLSFQGNQLIIDLINGYNNIDEIKNLLNFPVFDVNKKNFFMKVYLIYI